MENKNISIAFLKAQKQFSSAKKDALNPFLKSKYADLNSVMEACFSALHENGICVIQPIVSIDGKSFVNTILLHETGEKLESFTEIICKNINDAQAYGSGITYARRYGLQSICCIGADDDDGNKATKVKLPELKANTKEFEKCKEGINNGYTIAQIKTKYTVSSEIEKLLLS